jgi:nucleotide-binding universal stress UspA family protein
MYPWRRILIPTDFSTASEWVFEDAVRIAGTTGAEIVILHIRMTRTSQPTQLRFPADPSLYDYAEQIELEKLRDRVRRANAAVPTRLLVKQAPDPGGEVSRTAALEKVDLIVMSTHARHHVAHLFIGSTTLAVMVEPPAPVLAIRYGIQKREALRRLVVPIHPRQKSLAALELAAAMARREGGEVHLVTICDEADRGGAEQHLLELAATRLEGIASARALLSGNDVDREVLRYVEKNAADALFINATDSPSPLKIDIVRHAPVPVMIVPAG